MQSAKEISDGSVYYDGNLPAKPDLYIRSEQSRFLIELCDFILVYGFLVFAVPGIVTLSGKNSSNIS